ncbi:MAG TPA: FAD-dependent oxidoreductase [Bryobacteraceae bacterium]|nr:FAD-dependent oxidoreductase [Bryobacteraceae bacterium]
MTESMGKPVSELRLFGTRGSPAAYTIRDFLQRSDVSFRWVELTTDGQARTEANVEGLSDARLPVCIFPDGTRLERPTVRQVTEKLGWFLIPSQAEYDLAIYGGGPAGLSAAVYGASEGLKTVLIERSAIGGQASTSSKIENYFGFPGGISGADLTVRAAKQACQFGAEILLLREGVRGEIRAGKGVGFLADGTKIVARATICATGINYRRLELPNEEAFHMNGVYYGAGSSEAALCRGEHVFVVGGGNSAGQAAMHFSQYAKRVSVVIRGDSLKKTLSEYLVDRIRARTNIEVLVRTDVAALHGNGALEAVTLRNNRTGDTRRAETRNLFLCLGGVPYTEWADAVGIVRDSEGYLMTGPDLLKDGKWPELWQLDRAPYYLETSVPGIFAAGDVRHGSVKRCASAVGEGAMAVAFVHRYLANG